MACAGITQPGRRSGVWRSDRGRRSGLDTDRAVIMGRTMRDGRSDPRVRLGPGVGPDRFWPLVALIATVIATAGWTTVVVMSLSDRDRVAAVSPSDEPSEEPSDVAVEDSPIPLSHDAPELEALLPTTVAGVDMAVDSVTGEGALSENEWSQSILTFLDDKKKTPADLLVAQSYDPTYELAVSVAAFSVSDVKGAELRDALIAAWKAQAPDLTTTSETIAGKNVARSDDAGTYWYQHGDVVFVIETTDPELASAGLETLP
jgi:hypothetical protein